jgi:hypothetical protein
MTDWRIKSFSRAEGRASRKGRDTIRARGCAARYVRAGEAGARVSYDAVAAGRLARLAGRCGGARSARAMRLPDDRRPSRSAVEENAEVQAC